MTFLSSQTCLNCRRTLVIMCLITKNRFWIFLLVHNNKKLGEVRMSCYESTLRDLREIREMQTERKKTELASQHGRNFFTGLCNQLYPLLDKEFLNKAYPSIITANVEWFFEGSKTYRFFNSLEAVVTLTANYSEVLRIEILEQTTVNLIKLPISTRILDQKLITLLSYYHFKQLIFISKVFVFQINTKQLKSYLFGVFTITKQFF